MNPEQLLQNIQNRLCVIITNYGDDSLALIQWALESKHLQSHLQAQRLKVVYVDTGFEGQEWQERVKTARAFVEAAGIEAVHLTAAVPFANAILGRGAFPTPKFQWCATILKGLPILDWLDIVDPTCRAVLLSAKRRATLLPAYQNLLEWNDKSEHFNDRSLWHPLIDMSENVRNELLERAHFKPLGHRSLECDPCINSHTHTLANLTAKDIEKVKVLEKELCAPMFDPKEFEGVNTIEKVVTVSKRRKEEENSKVGSVGRIVKQNPSSSKVSELSLFYRGCGNPFSCGI